MTWATGGWATGGKCISAEATGIMVKAKPHSVCLVSPGHLSSNPRLVKEAQALAASGYQVQVVVSDQVPWFSELDQQMPERRRLTGPRLPRQGPWVRRFWRLRQEGYRLLVRLTLALKLSPRRWWLAEAFQPACRRLRSALGTVSFDLAIAHNLAALPAVAEVAGHRGKPYAFDAEDSHVDELQDHERFERRLRERLERAYLKEAAYVSASSPGIARALATRYHVEPEVVLNVFPAPQQPIQRRASLSERPGDPIRFFWFSQTVGPDRGIQGLLAAARTLQRPAALTLVGRPVAGFDRELAAEAERCGVALRLEPLVAPETLYALAAEHDCGLALEPNTPVNKNLCLANKIFTYLAVGLPFLLSSTAAHRDLAPRLEGAALLVDAPMSELDLNAWLAQELVPGRAAAAARRIFAERYNWARESRRYLACVERALGVGA